MSAWSCSRCAVRVRFMNGHMPPADLPECWEREDGELRCLACRRQAAVEAALAEAASDARTWTISRVRRDTLIRFELLRDPERSNLAVAKSLGTTPNRVGAARAVLIEAGEIERRRPRKRRKPKPHKPPKPSATRPPKPKPRPAVERRCAECGGPLPAGATARRIYCGDTCWQRVHRRRVRARRSA